LEISSSAPIEHENLTRRVVRYEHDGIATAPLSRLRDNCPHRYKVNDLLTIHPLVALSGNHSVHWPEQNEHARSTDIALHSTIATSAASCCSLCIGDLDKRDHGQRDGEYPLALT
jgi:hypothetical protein